MNDYESIGYLFEEVSKDWLKPNLIERFWSYLYELLLEISESFNKNIQELIKLVLKSDKFFSKLLNIFLKLTTETRVNFRNIFNSFEKNLSDFKTSFINSSRNY